MPRRPVERRRPFAVLTTAAALVLTLAACTIGTQDQDPAPTTSASRTGPTGADAAPARLTAAVTVPAAAATVLPAATPEGAAVEASRAIFSTAPVVVLAAASDAPGQLTGASAAVALGVPELLTSTVSAPQVAAELARLRPVAVLVVGRGSAADVPADVTVVRVEAGADAALLSAVVGTRLGTAPRVTASHAAGAVRALDGSSPVALVSAEAPAHAPGTATPRPSATATSRPPTPAPSPALRPVAPSPAAPPASATATAPAAVPPVLPPTARPAAPASTAAVLGVGVEPVAALATFRAAGVPVLDAPTGDPRATTASVRAFAAEAPRHVLALGEAFGDADRLATRVRAASTGVVSPGGGQLVFPSVPGEPGKRYVALYGTPGTKSLGVLGEQDVPQTVARAEKTAARYRSLTHDTVVPAVEIIATVASSGAGKDGDYSRERSVAELRPLVEAAGSKGLAVLLDLQPGRADFLSQAKRYESLLELPYVGLALDPEWRLTAKQKPLKQIGSVDVQEVNRVVDWLADLTAAEALPQKPFVVHQFALKMIADRADLDTSRDELAMIIHVDGQGSQPAKAGTWKAVRANAPDVHWGWKNFVDEDHPMLSPKETYQVRPTPDLVTYQ